VKKKTGKGVYGEDMRELLESLAFGALTATSIRVYFAFLARRQMENVTVGNKKGWTCINNGQIVFPYREAEQKFHLNMTTFARAITQLVEYGFLDIAHAGGGLQGDCTLYTISDRWKKWGTPEFEKKERQKDNRRLGFQAGRKSG